MKGKSTKAKKIYSCDSEHGIVIVWEQGDQRWMTFGDVLQTVIDLSNPSKLVSPFNQAILAALLFVDTPSRALLVGMGGGAIPRYFHNMDVGVVGDVVEWSEAVADIANKYFEFPGEKEGWNTHILDAREYIKSTNNNYEMIVIDVAEGVQTPRWVSDIHYLEHFKKNLMSNGVVVFNLLVPDGNAFLDCLRNIRKVFDRKTACLTVPDYRNIVVFAFNTAPSNCNIKVLNQRAHLLEQQWGLGFRKMLDQLYKDNPSGKGVI